jgi:pyruvate formate-lyase activating enzyme-like uncharacterized protein
MRRAGMDVDFVKLAERIVNEQNLRGLVAEKYEINKAHYAKPAAAAAKEIKKGGHKMPPAKSNLDFLLNSALVVTGVALVGLFVYNFL